MSFAALETAFRQKVEEMLAAADAGRTVGNAPEDLSAYVRAFKTSIERRGDRIGKYGCCKKSAKTASGLSLWPNRKNRSRRRGAPLKLSRAAWIPGRSSLALRRNSSFGDRGPSEHREGARRGRVSGATGQSRGSASQSQSGLRKPFSAAASWSIPSSNGSSSDCEHVQGADAVTLHHICVGRRQSSVVHVNSFHTLLRFITTEVPLPKVPAHVMC
jgi:hypothetical protein